MSDFESTFAIANLDVHEFVALRREIHRFPELGFEEFKTSDLVASCLREWGYEVHTGIAGTGVVARLRLGDGKKTLGLRADMDALPIAEQTDLPYASQHAGKMHACGHDGHTAMLLGAARLLSSTCQFNGTLNLIFQPAEEGGGGARRMIEEGLFDRFPCDAIFALHNAPGFPAGDLLFRCGPMMASSDRATVTVTGRGGHSAMPHLAGDPVVAAASIVMALQTVVSRNVDPLDTAVLTVSAMQAGTASNVIPGTAVLQLSLRALRPDTRQMLFGRLREIVEAQAQSFGVRAHVAIEERQPVLVNDEASTRRAIDLAIELLGQDKVIAQTAPTTGSEDFAWMLAERPGCYFFLGNGDQPGSCMVHNPSYDFNDLALPTGIAFWALLAERFLT